jgi:hypothetical protein
MRRAARQQAVASKAEASFRTPQKPHHLGVRPEVGKTSSARVSERRILTAQAKLFQEMR